MKETTTLLAASVERLLGDFVSGSSPGRDATMAPGLWEALGDAGLTQLGVPEDRGGSGGSLNDIFVVLAAAARHAVRLPLAESLQAAALLAEAGIAPQLDCLGVATGQELRLIGRQLTAAIDLVPWADAVTSLVLIVKQDDEEHLVRLRRDQYRTVLGANLAGEPRDTVLVDTAISDCHPLPAGGGARQARRAALMRAFQVYGAADRALKLSIAYAGQREQFGRPIGKFQAVQQQIAEAAGEVVALQAACESAARVCDEHGLGSEAGLLSVASAKGQASLTATTVARVAHQVHGAIGLTAEHSLGHATTRLWAWRDEDGDERFWFAFLADAALTSTEPDLWSLLTRES